MKRKDRTISIMGIVNLTEDSYFSESRCLGKDGSLDTFNRRVSKLLSEGADIIDIGACSTRPGSEPVGEDEEWRRLEPALVEMKNNYPGVKVSVDTYIASVVRKAFDCFGDFIVNDISAGEDNRDMLPTVGSLGLKYIAMHKRGDSKTMQTLTDYGQDDTYNKDGLSPVTSEVLRYFRDFAEKAALNGIEDWVLDPGFGFAKTVDQNYDLLREMDAFQEFHRPVLAGVSRKSMIYRLFGISPEEALPATQVVHLAALQKGVDILRVHDVREAVQTVKIYRKL